ncbi:ATP-dependent HslUV protease, peptidase subunit HslV [Thermosulfidibacter takaii ABI70S6]|uniref:ATP-dependent protease subunit HslV n=1 Tax=Thermosulfidibacter takaii (strain DSM 17441 / JCM 13301 / NBRC 103674 / ABI70S6) TaxID=1298851 RepID=A0A0S3QRD2_THET7|nr:ATP-dependent protease subunit HslV [Thermosulfidibacter takaii]BAT70879.1 ATP-dependent HslUV protease, peptidase subunit HslV [Thermosulfidibacter takaii ABI70S6]
MNSTTVLCIKGDNRVVMAADGQVTLGSIVMKAQARKVRKIYHDKVIVGFAGASADAITLMMRLEGKLEEYGGNLARAVVELAKDWRMDKALRRLEALMAVADKERAFLVSGTGDVMEPDDGIIAIGSGGPYALAAARALVKHSNMDLKDIVLEAMKIAADICIYTNHNIIVEELK